MSYKAGSRHSKDDHKRIRTASGHARSIIELMDALGDQDYQDDDPVKRLSLGDIQRSVALQVERQLYAAGAAGYVVEVYGDSAIVCTNPETLEYYAAPYSIEGNTVTVEPRANWVQVEETYTPIAVQSTVTKRHAGGAITVKGSTESGGLRVGGYLVTYGSPDQTDLSGEFFTAETDYGFDGAESIQSAVYFNHRLPLKTAGGGFVVVKERIGSATLTQDDTGILVDAVLFNRAQYEQLLAALGWSSGTASHLVEYESVGKSVWIKSWPLGLDASITPTPNEPRNHARALEVAQKALGDSAAAMAPADDIRIHVLRRHTHG